MCKFTKTLVIKGGGRGVIILIILMISSFASLQVLNAQTGSDSTNNFFLITAEKDAYYDSLIQIRGVDSMQGTGYTGYLRWKAFMTPRVDDSGTITGYANTINNYYDVGNSRSLQSNYTWNYFAPSGSAIYNNNGENLTALFKNSCSLKLFPNPAGTYFTVDYRVPLSTTVVYLQLHDVNGKPITTVPLYKTEDQKIIETGPLPAGLYTVSLFADGVKAGSRKLMIVK